MYQQERKRRVSSNSYESLEQFLEGLKMEATMGEMTHGDLDRVHQLISKTNQFNLTTRRYTEADLRAMESDPDIATFQVRLADRFGDNGMICVVICRANHDVWEIDSWLMSCRVLGRKVEDAVLNELVRAGRAAGKNGLTGIFRDSGRNELAHELYPKLGFLFANEEDRETRWRLDFAGYVEHPVPMTVHR